MHQIKKGNEWYFEMKVHADVDAGSGYVHTITGTSANMHDVSETANLIREDDEAVYGDSGYHGAVNQPAIKKVVYRGIAKNMHRFHMLFASANLIMCSRAGRTRDFIGCTV